MGSRRRSSSSKLSSLSIRCMARSGWTRTRIYRNYFVNRHANALTIPVIASGGLASMADIERLMAPDAAILEGAITGRALYDGRIDPAAALERLARAA